MKVSQALSFTRVLIGLAAFSAATAIKAAPVAIDTLSVGSVDVTIAITGDGTYYFSETIAPPVDVVMGTYQDPIAAGTNWKVYTAPGSGGNPPPSGTVDASLGSISVDLSSLRGQFTLGSWGTHDFALWPLTTPPSGGSYNGSTDAFTLNWNVPFSFTAVIGSFPPVTVSGTATVGIAGTATPVPVPAALWLLGSGLIAVGGFARRRMRA